MVVVAVVSTVQYQDLVHDERRAAEGLVGITEIRSAMQRAESSLRSYAISAEPATLDAFVGAADVVGRIARRVQADLDAGVYGALRDVVDDFDAWYRGVQVAAVQGGELTNVTTELFQTALAEVEDSVRQSLDRIGSRLDTAAAVAVVAMVGAGVAALAVALTLGRRLRHQVAEPMVELAADTARLGDGDLSVRSTVGGVQEIDDIAGAFNAMAGRLESTVSGLRELDDMKSAFVSTVSHELRTPLTSILGYTDALLDGEAGPLNEEQEEYAQAVQRNARRLHSLVDDLLTVSRLDAGRIHLEHRRVALGPIVEATCADLRSRADGKGVAVSVDVRDAAVVDGDAVRLGQIVTNLMSNAVKFTPGGGSVRVGVQRDDGHVDLVVADQGIGIPADELPRLFERFFRASTAGHVEGTGLGLSITRELVELHGGTLSVTSTEGEGSTFRVRLPVAADQPS